MSLVDLSATELLTQLNSGDVSAVEVSAAFLQRIDARDDEIRAFLRVNREAVLEQAAAIDRRRQRGETLGRLAGLPVAVKDVLCTHGDVTTCGSRMLGDFRPPYDATVVAALRAEIGRAHV